MNEKFMDAQTYAPWTKHHGNSPTIFEARDRIVRSLASLKIEAPTEPFHLMRSKPITSNQPIRNKKSSAKQKTIMATPFKNESCHVCDEILPKKRKRSIFNEFFIVHNQLCEISGRVLLRAF